MLPRILGFTMLAEIVIERSPQKQFQKKSKMVPMVLRILWFWSVRTMAVTVRLFTPFRGYITLDIN